MALPSRITIVGSTVWSTLLARGLASRNAAVTFINTAPGTGIGYAAVAVSALARAGITPGRKVYPLANVGRMTITEFDTLDQIISSSRLQDAASQILIADRAAMLETVLKSAGVTVHRVRQIRHYRADSGAITVQYGRESMLECDLLILTGGPAAAAGQVVASQADPGTDGLELVTEVGWADHGHDRPSLRLLDGPVLVGGQASLMLCPGGTYLTMTNSLGAVADAHLETREIIDELVGHPGIEDILPPTKPSYTANTVRPLRIAPVASYAVDGVLDLSHLSGLIDPFSIEADLAVGVSAANTLGALLESGAPGVAAVSQITRAALRARQSAHSIIADLRATVPTWTERQADVLLMRQA